MNSLAEKRVYADRAGASQLVVAAAPGLAVVSLADGRVGEFGVARRCSPAAVAVPAEPADVFRLAAATDEDVLLADEPAVDALEPSGFGPAVGVTFHPDRVVAAAADGRIGAHEGGDWSTVGEVPAAPTGLDGDLVGTPAGVFRLVGDSLRPAGLSDVTDVAHAAGVPLAATTDGLYELGNGWLDVLEGDVELVDGGPDGRAHAATAGELYERAAGAWAPVELPTDDPVAAVAYGERTYVLTGTGDLLVEAADGWRSHPVGLDGVVAAAVL